MQKQTPWLSAMLALAATSEAIAALPSPIPGQAAMPGLAPLLEKVLPAVVSVRESDAG